MRHMGIDKLPAPFNNKKDVYSNISNIRLATNVKASLIRVSSEVIKSKRVPAYRYLLP
jgi:hypothetical protein